MRGAAMAVEECVWCVLFLLLLFWSKRRLEALLLDELGEADGRGLGGGRRRIKDENKEKERTGAPSRSRAKGKRQMRGRENARYDV